jgi:hypothetical protein
MAVGAFGCFDEAIIFSNPILGESRDYLNERKVYSYTTESYCLILRVFQAGTDLFFMEQVNDSITVVRKEDSAGSTLWAKKLFNKTTGDLAVTSTGSFVYVRLFHVIENVQYLVELNGATGVVASTIKGYDRRRDYLEMESILLNQSIILACS